MCDYIDKARDLALAHWKETESHLSDTAPALAVDLYRLLENGGNIIAFGAFDGDELVGYCVGILSPHLHYGFMYCQHDLLFIREDFRKGRTGLKLIKAVEEEAKAKGARFMAWHAKPGSTLEKVLSITGHTLEEVIYRKEF